MRIPAPDSSKRARIVHQIVGPTSSLHLRHVPSGWVIVSIRRGYEVEEGFTVEDWNPIIAGMMDS